MAWVQRRLLVYKYKIWTKSDVFFFDSYHKLCLIQEMFSWCGFWFCLLWQLFYHSCLHLCGPCLPSISYVFNLLIHFQFLKVCKLSSLFQPCSGWSALWTWLDLESSDRQAVSPPGRDFFDRVNWSGTTALDAGSISRWQHGWEVPETEAWLLPADLHIARVPVHLPYWYLVVGAADIFLFY